MKIIKNLTQQEHRETQDIIGLLSRNRPLMSLVRDIISDYGISKKGVKCMDFHALSLAEKKLLLSHIVSADEYEWASVDVVNAEALIKEYEHILEALIDAECEEMSREYFREPQE